LLDQSKNSDNPIKQLKRTKIDIIKSLGKGGQAHVFLGRIVELNQLIAIKQFDVTEESELKIMEDIRHEM